MNRSEDVVTLGGTFSNTIAINEAGQVIGSSKTPYGVGQHAFVWDSANGMQDLGTLGGTFSIAIAINEAGQVIGFSRISSGVNNTHLFGILQMECRTWVRWVVLLVSQ